MNPAPTLTRRRLLKLGLGGSLVLGGVGLLAGLQGIGEAPAAAGFATLRQGDLPLLRRLAEVVLAGSVAPPALAGAVEGTLEELDGNLAHLSPALLTQVRQLFDLLALPITRGPATGIWGRWEDASNAQLLTFLERWRTSHFDLLRQGQATLLQLIQMGWYGRREAWAHCGYPGPPTLGA